MEASWQDLTRHAKSSGEVPAVPGQMPTCCSCVTKTTTCHLNADNTGVLLFSLKYLTVTGTPYGGSLWISAGWRRFSRKIPGDQIWGGKSPDFKQ